MAVVATARKLVTINFSLRSALGIPRVDIWEAHTRCKSGLLST